MTGDHDVAANMTGAEPRHVGGFLMLGLIAVPIVFVWFLLRPGYARSLRLAAFSYTFALPVLALIADAGSYLSRP
jgi:hypothetical protein